ncbi:sigma 54-interacting transcriptional regulator [Glaciecola sp. 1036]|uniref:sigma 54-interacting transcriptional regulator n=1 Tax=Alteromonadaceae TaxID=72275 RepID=UPI003CFF6DDE
MTLVSAAQHALLLTLRYLTQCDFVRLTVEGNKLQRIDSGDLTDQIYDLLSSTQRDFQPATFYQIPQHHIELSIINQHHAHIIVSDPDLPAETGHDSRRQKIVVKQNNRDINVDLVSIQKLPQWLTDMATQSSEENALQSAFLHQLGAVATSLSLFKAYEKFTQDSLTKLQSRNALQSAIDSNIDKADMILCMIHCRDFQVVNRKFGQAKGDIVLHEIATIINQQTRTQDIACRFGGALFGIATHANSIDEGKAMASKLQQELHARPYLKNAVRLSFNVGVAICSAEEIAPDDSSASSILISRAEQALRAAQTSDKPSVVMWEAGKFNHDEQDFNYLGGIFTPDNVTNYRNMLLLWDISSIIADEHEFSKLLISVIERLAYTFEFSFAGILSERPDAGLESVVSVEDIDNIHYSNNNQLPLQQELRSHLATAITNGQVEESEDNGFKYLLIPLGTENKECFFIIGQHDKLDLTHDSIMLFAGFARQIGKALKRSQLEEQLNKNLEQQNARLAQELQELKSGLQSSALVYRSDVMQHLMMQTQRAAQTDTTVLITGESGTGKEKLIHAVHSLSTRADKPLVIVDCGSIPETLIESELFGHIKGAFTGAQSEKIGKIKAADKGILVLDEIGELPMSMQPKLLRFVQEKHYTPVGSTKQISVDVKIVAVTNRNLLAEVEKGNFRQDLYYRLNVVTLHNPPLRQRLEDLEVLCQHFLAKFAKQYDVERKYISEATFNKMRAYAWPGNVRELENLLMQAFLLSQNDEICFDDLHIKMPSERQSITLEHESIVDNSRYEHKQEPDYITGSQEKDAPTYPSTLSNVNRAFQEQFPARQPSEILAQGKITEQEWVFKLSNALQELVQEVNSSISFYDLNIGDLMENALFKALLAKTKTNKEIAEKMRIPISTARRKAQRAEIVKIPSKTPDAWSDVEDLLQALANGQVLVKEPLPALKLALVKIVLNNTTGNMTRAASQVGVSEPTLYKLKKQL